MPADSFDLQKERLMADLRTVIADAEGLLKLGGAEAGEAASDARVKLQDRLAQLKGSLTGGAMSFSGSAFEGDVKALAAKGVEGIETEAVTLLLEKMYRAENDRLAQSLQQAFETQ